MDLSNFGLALAGQGRIAEGLEACRNAVTMEPQMPIARVSLGRLLAKQGQYAEAQACFEAALALDPNDAGAENALKELAVEVKN